MEVKEIKKFCFRCGNINQMDKDFCFKRGLNRRWIPKEKPSNMILVVRPLKIVANHDEGKQC